MDIGEEKYVATTTYRKSGDGVVTATWIVPLDRGRVGFWTSSKSWKAKRLRANPRIRLQASDSRGRAKADAATVEGTAELVTSGTDFESIQAQVRKKYGIVVPISRFMNTIGHRGKWPYGDVCIVVTPAEPAAG